MLLNFIECPANIIFYKILSFKHSLNFSESFLFTLKVPETKIAEFAKSQDLNEVAHHEPPHLDLHCFPSSL